MVWCGVVWCVTVVVCVSCVVGRDVVMMVVVLGYSLVCVLCGKAWCYSGDGVGGVVRRGAVVVVVVLVSLMVLRRSEGESKQ